MRTLVQEFALEPDDVARVREWDGGGVLDLGELSIVMPLPLARRIADEIAAFYEMEAAG